MLQSRADVEFIDEFAEATIKLWKTEDAAAERLQGAYRPYRISHQDIQAEAGADPTYQKTRSEVSSRVERMKELAAQLGIPEAFQSIPGPMIGGPIITIHLFDSILFDNSHGGIDRQLVVDALNKTRSAALERWRQQRRNLFNPLHWIRRLIVFILRLPFTVFSLAGFDVTKVEDHILAKLFKLAEFVFIGFVLWRMFGPEKLSTFIASIIERFTAR